MPTIEQIAAVAYPAVLAENRKPENQWVENAALRYLEKIGAIKKVAYGENIEVPVDYRRNPDGGVLASDMDASSGLKTEVISTAVYDIAQISYWVTWTKGDDAKTPSENQKVQFVQSLIENGINTHDDLIEQLIFTTSTVGGGAVEVNGLDTLVPDSGQGTVGGIDASTDTWWRNFSDTYTDETDIMAAFVEADNFALKGTGSKMGPTCLIGGSTPHALYESQLQAQQRWVNTGERGNGGFKALAFRDKDFIFSQFGDDHVYFLNPKSYRFTVSKQYFRDKGSTEVITGQNAFQFPIYSAVQALVTNKSRLAVVRQA